MRKGEPFVPRELDPPPTSAVGLVKWAYRRATRRQRAMIRAWMRLVLSGKDGNK